MGSDLRFLVTGGNGQLARAFALIQPEAIVLDRAQLDICDQSRIHEIFQQHHPDVIVNAAAYTKVDGAETEEAIARTVNANAVGYLAEEADAIDAHLVQVSTDYVFDGSKQGPYLEDDDTAPISAYGRTKLEGEQAAMAAQKWTIVRTSWVFGDGHNFIRSIVAAAATHPSLTVVDDQLGLPTYAMDLADGIRCLVETGQAEGIYHLAGGGESGTWADLAEVAIQAAHLKSQVVRVGTTDYYADKPGPIAPRPANSVLDCSKAASLGVRLRPWHEAVVAYVNLSLKEKV